MGMMRFVQERARLRKCGIALTKKEGEYRVTFGMEHPLYVKERSEAVAYYTLDLTDAVETGKRMAEGW
jgi:hypothetical protein